MALRLLNSAIVWLSPWLSAFTWTQADGSTSGACFSTPAGGARFVVTDCETVVSRLVGAFGHRGVECWGCLALRCARPAAPVSSGQSALTNCVIGTCKGPSALVRCERGRPTFAGPLAEPAESQMAAGNHRPHAARVGEL